VRGNLTPLLDPIYAPLSHVAPRVNGGLEAASITNTLDLANNLLF